MQVSSDVETTDGNSPSSVWCIFRLRVPSEVWCLGMWCGECAVRSTWWVKKSKMLGLSLCRVCVMWYVAKVTNTEKCFVSRQWRRLCPWCLGSCPFCLSIDALMSVVFFWHSHWGWGERLSTIQVQRLRQRRPRVLWRKGDCTPAVFLTFSRSPSTSSGDYLPSPFVCALRPLYLFEEAETQTMWSLVVKFPHLLVSVPGKFLGVSSIPP